MNDKIIVFLAESKAHIDSAFHICQEKLGKNYITISEFENFAIKKNLLIATINEKVVGFLFFEMTTEQMFYKSIKIIKNSNIPVLVLKTIAVKDIKKGIGTALVNYCINNFLNNAKKIFTPVWKSKFGINALKLIQKFGFKEIETIKNYWYKDSLNKENYCPVCNSPCVCDLVVFCKII